MDLFYRQHHRPLDSPPLHKAEDDDGHMPPKPGPVWPHSGSISASLGLQSPERYIVQNNYRSLPGKFILQKVIYFMLSSCNKLFWRCCPLYSSTVGILQWDFVCDPDECGPLPGHCPCCCSYEGPNTPLWNHSQHHNLVYIFHHGNPTGDICQHRDGYILQQLPEVPATVPGWQAEVLEEAA